MNSGKLQRLLELVALLSAAITFGVAYYLLFLAHPVWTSVPFEAFLPVFQATILKIGLSQVTISTLCIVVSLILFLMTKRKAWLLVIVFLLISLPITMLYLMPINIQFLEWADPSDAGNAAELLTRWGQFQIVRFVCDGLALVAIWYASTSNLGHERS